MGCGGVMIIVPGRIIAKSNWINRGKSEPVYSRWSIKVCSYKGITAVTRCWCGAVVCGWGEGKLGTPFMDLISLGPPRNPCIDVGTLLQRLRERPTPTGQLRQGWGHACLPAGSAPSTATTPLPLSGSIRTGTPGAAGKGRGAGGLSPEQIWRRTEETLRSEAWLIRGSCSVTGQPAGGWGEGDNSCKEGH